MQQVKNASLRFAVVGYACWTLALCFGAKAQDAAPPSAQILADRLMSGKSFIERDRAATDIFVRQRELEQALLRNFSLLQKKPGEDLRRFDGPFQGTMRVMGELRIKEAAFVLLPLIDFQLDPTTERMRGHAYPDSFYPVARALVSIGGPDVLAGIFQRLSTPADDRTLRACTWVLSEMLGRDVAVAAIEQKAGAEAKRLRPDLWVGSVHKGNVEKAKALLEGLEPILVHPTDEAKAQQAAPPAPAATK